MPTFPPYIQMETTFEISCFFLDDGTILKGSTLILKNVPLNEHIRIIPGGENIEFASR